MRIEEIGEFGLIEKISELAGTSSDDVVLSIGDDAAVVKTSSNLYTLLTTENFLEGVHFKLDSISPYQLGYKSLAVNLSDIAAMAGLPRFVLVSLALKPKTKVKFVDELYKGMLQLAKKFGVNIIGGDTSSSIQVSVNVTVIGEVEPELFRIRGAAQIGDKVLVTGNLGASSAGLELLLKFADRKISEFDKELKNAHLLPQPRIKEARIAAKMGAKAMEDISDGLAIEIKHICQSSGVGAHLLSTELPVARGVNDVAAELGKNPLDFVLAGGEDYELVFTASSKLAGDITDAVENETGTKVTVVGEIIPSPKITIENGKGKIEDLPIRGYEHFSSLQ